MNTEKLCTIAELIDNAIQQGRELFKQEKECFELNSALPEPARVEAEIRTKLTTTRQREHIKFLIDAILHPDKTAVIKRFHHSTTQEPATGGRGSGSIPISEQAKQYLSIYERVKAEQDGYKIDYAKQFEGLKGEARKERALLSLSNEFRQHFSGFTEQDAKDGKHTPIMQIMANQTQYKIWSKAQREYALNRSGDRITEIAGKLQTIGNNTEGRIIELVPGMLRELRINLTQAAAGTKADVVELYEADFKRQLSGITGDAGLSRLMRLHDSPPITEKAYITTIHNQIKRAVTEHEIRRAGLDEQPAAYSFFISLSFHLYGILDQLAGIRATIPQEPAETAKGGAEVDKLIEQINTYQVPQNSFLPFPSSGPSISVNIQNNSNAQAAASAGTTSSAQTGDSKNEMTEEQTLFIGKGQMVKALVIYFMEQGGAFPNMPKISKRNEFVKNMQYLAGRFGGSWQTLKKDYNIVSRRLYDRIGDEKAIQKGTNTKEIENLKAAIEILAKIAPGKPLKDARQELKKAQNKG